MQERHIQLPNDLIQKYGITPKELFVFLAIKSFENSKTHLCNPPLQLIAKMCDASINTVQKCIKVLLDKGCISIERKGRSIHYIFPDYINFEKFSFEFLKCKGFSMTQKGYLVAMQQYMYKEDNEHGVVTYNNHELSKLINMPERTIRKCNQDLVNKHLLTIIKTAAVDDVGCNRYAKVFNMRQYMQSVAFMITKHELDVRRHDEDINQNKQDIAAIKEALAEIKKQQEADKKLVDLLIKENKSLKEQLEQKEELVL